MGKVFDVISDMALAVIGFIMIAVSYVLYMAWAIFPLFVILIIIKALL